MPTFPMLKLGSVGEVVKTLQAALNLWPISVRPLLDVDGHFGPLTGGKVREFQTANKLVPDGIVGPLTWESLRPLVDQILKGVTRPQNEIEAGERIVAVAESALATFGWGGAAVTPDPKSIRIAAAVCADPSNPLRPRQGGTSLLTIFQIATAPAIYTARCPTISNAAVGKWQEVSLAATTWRNSNDIPAWCGIFCYYVYRIAGFDLDGWVSHANNVLKRFRKFADPTMAFRGCIGVEDGIRGGGRNHHFLVIDNQNGLIRSIDGNSFGPVDGDFSQGLKSVIARKSYTHARLRKDLAYFLFPDFTKL